MVKRRRSIELLLAAAVVLFGLIVVGRYLLSWIARLGGG
jgi:hypothetical protein